MLSRGTRVSCKNPFQKHVGLVSTDELGNMMVHMITTHEYNFIQHSHSAVIGNTFPFVNLFSYNYGRHEV